MKWLRTVLLFLPLSIMSARASTPVTVDPHATPRELYGASKLQEAFESPNFHAPRHSQVLAAVRSSNLFGESSSLSQFAPNASEAFHILRFGNKWLVIGSDPSGVLYGCMELARLAVAAHTLPAKIDVYDHPAFRIRGTNLFWMKRGKYNWEVTPENFPWFFDRALMIRYLDELAANRYNTIFFWNGHPFPYFLKLQKFPEAQVLSDSDLERNIEYFRWFTNEADRRGLWTVFHFYNIHVSPNFAKAHAREGVREENSESTPLLNAYMRYCISEFVNAYPSVGLMLTAGEALNVNAEEYVRDVIIAGIKDTGKHPPLIVRQWTIDPYRFRAIILPNYDNLFTMMKHNTEMLVSPYPDERNRLWVSFGKQHIVNLHELGDIKPFRWGSPLWIAQAVQNWQALGFSGFHVYPPTSWIWPSALDRTDPRINVIDRDAIWTEAFGRYGWQPNRPASAEELFWKARLSAKFGSAEVGNAVYNYYVKTGPVLPTLQNLVNIYNMNHFPTAVSEEATLNAILHSQRIGDSGDNLARPLDDVTLQQFELRFGKLSADIRSRAPLSVRESLLPHSPGIEPLPLADTLVSMAEDSLSSLEASEKSAALNQNELARFASDNRCILLLTRFYRAKLAAAIAKGKFDSTGDLAEYDKMLEHLEESVHEYRKLAELASRGYTQGTDLGEWHSWADTAKSFQQELDFYRAQRALTSGGADIVYLGLDGPMGDASNAFHWLLENFRADARWSSQSYALGSSPFLRAKLVVVYDLDSPAFLRNVKQLQSWIEHGGKVLFWNVRPASPLTSFLDGLSFTNDSSRDLPTFVAFADSSDPLLLQLRGSKQGLDPRCNLSPNVSDSSQDWRELAFTVVSSLNTEQIQWGYETFGPRWTSLHISARRPVLLSRKLGDGEVLFAQLGACHVFSKPAMAAERKDEVPLYLRELINDIFLWSAAQGKDAGNQ